MHIKVAAKPINVYDFMSVCLRILTLQSKRSQTSLQQILLHGELDILNDFEHVCYGFSLRFVEAVLNSVIEKNDKARVLSGGLIAAMLSRGLLGEVKMPLSCRLVLIFTLIAGTIPLCLGQHSPVCRGSVS